MPSSTVNYISPLQPENAPYPMFVMPSEIITLVSLLQPENAPVLMLVTLSGITTTSFNVYAFWLVVLYQVLLLVDAAYDFMFLTMTLKVPTVAYSWTF